MYDDAYYKCKWQCPLDKLIVTEPDYTNDIWDYVAREGACILVKMALCIHMGYILCTCQLFIIFMCNDFIKIAHLVKVGHVNKRIIIFICILTTCTVLFCLIITP